MLIWYCSSPILIFSICSCSLPKYVKGYQSKAKSRVKSESQSIVQRAVQAYEILHSLELCRRGHNRGLTYDTLGEEMWTDRGSESRRKRREERPRMPSQSTIEEDAWIP